MTAILEPRPVEQWEQILARLPAPNSVGVDTDMLCAERVLGDLQGYQHPGGNEATRRRRAGIKQRDAIELSRAMIAFARMYYDLGVRP
jgi:hypothetical protein